MKKVLSVLVVVLLLSVSALARTQTNSLAPAGNDTKKAEDEKNPKTKESGKTDNDPKDKKNKEQGKSSTSTTAADNKSVGSNTNDSTTDPGKTITSVPANSSVTNDPSTVEEPTAKANTTATPPALTNIYRVGAGDVLDIRLLNAQTRDSTLFTVMPDGTLEYPLAGEPLSVTGLTTDEIRDRLTSKIKLYDKPQVAVSVRQYASHNVIITGLVSDPGTHVLRREAMPLYVVLAEAQLKPEAGQATIVHLDRQTLTVNLSDPKAMTTFVMAGDVITVAPLPPAPPQYFYIGGAVNAPGQKDFHAGLTLTQAILASGGTTRFAGSKVKVSRQGKDGLLVTTEYNLKQIEAGKVPDPVIQPGDRVDVGRSSW